MNTRNKKKGYTLVELIVVIGIMTVLLVVVGASVSLIFSNKTKSASKNIYNMVGAAKNLGMGKEKISFMISSSSEGKVTVGIVSGDAKTIVESKELGNKIDVSFTCGSKSYYLSAGKSFYIPIDRQTGGFKAAMDEAGLNMGTCTDILIGSGSNAFDIGLVALTGKVYYK